MRYPWRATALLLLTACAHEIPAAPMIVTLDSLPTEGAPMRLTWNPGADKGAAFAPDGQTLWYSWEDLDHRDHDFCLGVLPSSGGTRRSEVCHTRPTANPDSVNWYLWAAPHPDGKRMAWFRLSAFRGAALSFPFSGEVVLATLATPSTPMRIDSIRGFPFLVAPSHFHQQPEHLVWENDSTLLYLAVLIAVEFGQGLPEDTLRSGVEVGTLTLGADGVRMGYVPGTAGASGVTPGPDNTLYFTLNGDNRIYRTTVLGGTPEVVFDLGPGTTVARDPAVRDTTAYVIVDGQVIDRFFATLGNIQSDGGGQLWRVTTTTRAPIDTSHLWRRPVLSPDGRTLVVEGVDSLTGKTDLYALRLP